MEQISDFPLTMANIQKENGFASIATEFLEAMLKKSMTDYQHRVFWAIIRKTWGWQKKKDVIPLSQIVKATGIDKSNVCKCLKFLKESNMILRDQEGMTQIQKDFDLWVVANLPLAKAKKRGGVVANEPAANLPTTSGEPANKLVANLPHSIDIKDTIQKITGKNQKAPSAEGGIFPPGNWTDSEFREVLENWNGRRTQTAHPFDVAVYYFLKFHERHRSVTDLEMERTREGVWKKEQKTWLFISKLDPLDDFVTTAICDMALKGEVIDEPIPFFRWAKKNYQGCEL